MNNVKYLIFFFLLEFQLLSVLTSTKKRGSNYTTLGKQQMKIFIKMKCLRNHAQITVPQTPISSLSVVSANAYFVLPYLLFDPINQFPFLFKNAKAKLLCSLCNRAGLHQNVIDSDQWKNGKTARLQQRLIHDVASPFFLVSKLYSCGNGHREIAACDPDLVKQLPDAFVNFVTSHKSGMTKSLIQLCEQLMDKGLSLRSIDDLNKQRYKTFYNEKVKRLVENRKISHVLGCSNVGETVPDLENLKSRCPLKWSKIENSRAHSKFGFCSFLVCWKALASKQT